MRLEEQKMDFDLQRLSYLIKKEIAIRGFPVPNVWIEKLADQFEIYIGMYFRGLDEEPLDVDCGPDGWFNTLLSLFGIPHRRKKAYLSIGWLNEDRVGVEVTYD